jgi:hypothetical protein
VGVEKSSIIDINLFVVLFLKIVGGG